MGSGGSIGEGGENKGNTVEVEFSLQRINGNIKGNYMRRNVGKGGWGGEVDYSLMV